MSLNAYVFWGLFLEVEPALKYHLFSHKSMVSGYRKI